MYLARRIVRMAVEDISLADPHALEICMAARDALDFMGLPEGGLALAEAAVYLAMAPKSNALYTAYGAVKRDVEETAADPVPLHLRNAPTRLMKELGYGEGYQYAHDLEDKVADMECLPDNLKDRSGTSRPKKALRSGFGSDELTTFSHSSPFAPRLRRRHPAPGALSRQQIHGSDRQADRERQSANHGAAPCISLAGQHPRAGKRPRAGRHPRDRQRPRDRARYPVGAGRGLTDQRTSQSGDH